MSEKTTKAKLTPGPWQIDRDSGGNSAEGAAYALNLIIETDEKHIAFVFDDQEANASLIAAAPDLLAALKDARLAIKIFHGPAAWDIYEKNSPEMKRIDAAIAKAEGK